MTTTHTPTVTPRPADERGRTQLPFLDSRHSFSFGHYHDPAHPGFRSLRVLNDDIIAPAGGFPTHPHRDMEIFSWVVAGQLTHQDSTGTAATIQPGQIQAMSAGSGIQHSEFNPSDTEPTRFLQIWIQPDTPGLPPSYSDATPDPADRIGRLQPIAGPPGTNASVTLHQDAHVFATELTADHAVTHTTTPDRGLWVQAVTGSLAATVGDQTHTLHQGDGLAIEHATTLTLRGLEDTPAQALLFDLA